MTTEGKTADPATGEAEVAMVATPRTKEHDSVWADIDAANASHLSKHGMTLPSMLLKYFQIFAKRPDVFVTNHTQGKPASAMTLARWHNQVPPEWLAVHAEIGTLHFTWVFSKDKAERDQFSEGYNGGRIALPDPEEFCWYPRRDWQEEDFDFKEDAVFDEFASEGVTMLSYGEQDEPVNAELIFDNANDCVRHPLGGIFDYLTRGARAGFTWYWQMGRREFTEALFQASLPPNTPQEIVEERLQKQGLSATEARALHSWLGEAVVILLHQP